MSSYYVFDLRDLLEDLQDHVRSTLVDTYCAVCPGCGEPIPQTADRCDVCDKPVVWKNSKVWKSLYGNPNDAIRRLQIVPPENAAAKHLCDLARVEGFLNLGEANRFYKAHDKLGSRETVRLVNLAYERLGKRGRALMRYALNLLARAAREYKSDNEITSPANDEPELPPTEIAY